MVGSGRVRVGVLREEMEALANPKELQKKAESTQTPIIIVKNIPINIQLIYYNNNPTTLDLLIKIINILINYNPAHYKFSKFSAH